MRCCVEVDVGNCWCDVYVFEFCNDICELSGLDWELVVANYIVVGFLQRVLARCRRVSRMVAPDFHSLVASA